MLPSHYLEDVKKLAKRLIIINKGHIIYDGSLKKILAEFSKEKKVTITLEEEVTQDKIMKIGLPILQSYPTVTYKIRKSELPEKMVLITQTLPYSDLSVEDEPIEEIIKSFFKSVDK